MITINGLTKSQVRMLDKMWSIDGYEEYMEWKSELCYAQKQQCELLETMVMLADIDEQHLMPETYGDEPEDIARAKAISKELLDRMIRG